MSEESLHPITLEVDERVGYDRRSIILRPVLILPAYLLLLLFIAPLFAVPEDWLGWVWFAVTGLGPGFLGALAIGTGAMIAFRGRYPRWWFEAHAELLRFGVRFLAYALLLTDRYPSTDTESDVRVIIEVPPTESPRDRRLALLKPLFVLPHVLVWLVSVAFLYWSAVFTWFAALFGMRLPGVHRDVALGVLDYGLVIYGYGFLHLTDRYPRLRDAPGLP